MEIFILIFTFMGSKVIIWPLPSVLDVQCGCGKKERKKKPPQKPVPCDADLHTLLTEARAVAECPRESL